MPIEIPCACGCGTILERRPSQISPGYKPFLNKAHEKLYKNTAEGKLWMQSWCKKPNSRIPHYRKKVIQIDH